MNDTTNYDVMQPLVSLSSCGICQHHRYWLQETAGIKGEFPFPQESSTGSRKDEDHGWFSLVGIGVSSFFNCLEIAGWEHEGHSACHSLSIYLSIYHLSPKVCLKNKWRK